MDNKRFLASALAAGALALGGSVALSAPAQADPTFPINWTVDTTTTLKKLNQTIVVPTGTFGGEFDAGAGTLRGDLALPEASKRLDLGALPLANATFAMEQAAPVTGTLDLGTFEAQTTATFNVRIVSIRPVLAPWLNLVAPHCQTRTPVVAQLGGKVDLAAGSTFTGTYEMPKFSGCGLAVTPIVNATVAGPGNMLSATFHP